MNTKHIFTSILLLLSIQLFSQSECVDTVYINTITRTEGALLALDVEVENFNDIESIQFGVLYNSSVVAYNATGNYNLPGLNASSFNTSVPGEIKTLWYDITGTTPSSLSNGTVLFTIYFDPLTAADPEISVSSIGNFTAEASNADEEVVCINDLGNTTNGGGPTVGCIDSVIVSTVLYTSGALTAIDIKVQNFNEISSIQFGVAYNSAALSYDSADNFNLNNFNTTNINGNEPGQVRLLWYDTSGTTPQTLADGSTIITLYFELLDSSIDPQIAITGFGSFIAEATNGDFEVLCINDLGSNNGTGGGPTTACLDVGLSTSPSSQSTLIDVTVDNFTDLKTVNFNIDYDENVLDFIGVYNLNADLGLTSNSIISQNGILSFIWEDTFGDGKTLPSGTILFQLEFTIPSNNFTSIYANPSITQDPIQNADDESICFSGDAVNMVNNSGGNPNDCTDTLYLDLIPQNGVTELSVGFQAFNFDDIASMQFTILYDATHLDFGGITSGALDLNTGFINANNPGEIGFTWIEATTQGTSLPDGSILFSVEFTTSSANNSVVTIGNNPVAVEITKSNNDGTLDIICLNYNETPLYSEGALLSGYVLHDINENCQEESNEIPLEGWIIQFSGLGSQFYSSTDNNGYYQALVIPGEYTVTAVAPNDLWTFCDNNVTSLTVNNGDLDEVDFLAIAEYNCPLMYVDVSTPFLRRCFSNTYHVNYCNYGTTLAEDVYINVTLDDDLIFEGTDFADYSIDNNVLTFNIGSMGVNACASLTFDVTVSCDAMLGATHCTEAIIYPAVDCSDLGNAWDGASLRVSGECEGDSVRFNILNEGVGNMLMPSEFIVIEDDVMLNSDEIILLSGETQTISYLATGATYRAIVDQVANHPGNSSPTVFIEGCDPDNDNEYSIGYALMFPQDEEDPWTDIDCQENIGSFDPNDKNAFPRGYGDEHYIKKNTNLEYKIRFQNTGTDTAFKVVIIDTLSTNLDVTSFRVGTSSHDYEFVLRNQEVRFIFNDIQLVDSFKNEPASHGFITYHIDQKADLEDGNYIYNEASIYFDFNEPIVTNRTYHEIASDFVAVVNATESSTILTSSQVFPHPLVDQSYIELDEEIQTQLQVRIIDTHGRTVRMQSQYGSLIPIHKGNLDKGLYYYEITTQGVLLSSGKLVIL